MRWSSSWSEPRSSTRMTSFPRCLLALTHRREPRARSDVPRPADSTATSEETHAPGAARVRRGGRSPLVRRRTTGAGDRGRAALGDDPLALLLRHTDGRPRARAVGNRRSAAFEGTTGVVDLPVDATLSHDFKAPWSPGVALALGVSLPLGDTASGFGAGKAGYSTSVGLGFSPAERLWVHLGAGRSLTDVAMQSAFASGSGWGDASAGVSADGAVLGERRLQHRLRRRGLHGGALDLDRRRALRSS